MDQMKRHSAQPLAARAFTLIEMVAILGVIAVLAAALVPALLKQYDRIAGQNEAAVLKSLSDGLTHGIRRNRSIPSQNTWAQIAATNAGFQISDVTNNTRRLPRLYMIDPALRIGTNASQVLPYAQTNSGSINPISPRLMIVSSISTPLPVSLSNGVASTTNFNAIWDAADGTVPASFPASWNGRGNDLKVQRINLTPLFHQLILNGDGSVSGGYSIDASVTNAISTNGLSAYFLDGTVLNLYATNALLAQQVLVRDTSFYYSIGNWSWSIINASGAGPGGGNNVFTNIDFIIPLFLNTASNPRSGETPLHVFQMMTNYFTTYNAWAAAGFPASGPLRDAVKVSGTGSAALLDAASLLLKQ